MEDQEKTFFEDKLKTENQLKSGANWFFWIAGLSIVNSLILLSGGKWSFIIGLGITQVIDAIGIELAKGAGIVGTIFIFFFDVFAAGIFIALGILSRKTHCWAFLVGMILYTMDGLLFLFVQDFLSIGFHAFALLCIYGGFKASKKLREMDGKAISKIYQVA